MIQLHRQNKERDGRLLTKVSSLTDLESRNSTPAWLLDFRDILSKKLHADAAEAAPNAQGTPNRASEGRLQQNQLRRLMFSKQEANADTHQFIQKMWYAYSPEG